MQNKAETVHIFKFIDTHGYGPMERVANKLASKNFFVGIRMGEKGTLHEELLESKESLLLVAADTRDLKAYQDIAASYRDEKKIMILWNNKDGFKPLASEDELPIVSINQIQQEKSPLNWQALCGLAAEAEAKPRNFLQKLGLQRS